MEMKNETITIGENSPEFAAYLAYPEKKKAPAIILIHEIWGLNDNIKDIADRFAAEGYLVLAPDLMTGSGAESNVTIDIMRELADPATRDEAQKKMRAALAPIRTPEFAEKTVEKLMLCFELLKSHPHSNGTVGVIGFCFGGTYAYALAVAESELAFSIPFYGQPPQPFENVATIACPVLAFYGEKDVALIETLPELKEAMKKHRKDFRAIVYPNTGHAFFNEKNPMLYNAEAAAKAWEEVKSFLRSLFEK